MIFFNIKVNACILTLPNNNYIFLGDHFHIHYFIYIVFLPYTQINGDQQSQGTLKK